MNAAIEGTGAVDVGRRTFAMADPDSVVGNYEFQVAIFVTEGVEAAIEQAKAAAGDKVGAPGRASPSALRTDNRAHRMDAAP